ncbi:Hypothetical protein, putative [Bodo saltans]|uniref:Uncharacterized protein n=1 Tax=Bodo saltans TaxID=75058 RepID=A0A0S4JT20_BODSA|nr:Hypothetical protein, putative [Bodo saltans]|eukprot:CUG92484.1 Hypothetical protein, putative [Bodo saltans]
MHLSRRLLTAPEFAATLLRSGRLADLSMLEHFTGVAATQANVTKSAEVTSANEKLELHNPRSWIESVFAQQPGNLYVSPEAQGSLSAKSAGGKNQFSLSGSVSAVNGDSAAPASAIACATLENGEAALFTFSALDAPTLKTARQHSGLRRRLDLNGHPSQLVDLPEGTSVPEYAAQQLFQRRIGYCHNVAKILESLQHVCALHASSAARYDALLLRDQQAQKTVAQLQCLRFGVETASSYAQFSGNASDAAMARLYAGSALETAAIGAKSLLGPLVALEDGTHTANPAIRIPYRYVGDVAQIAPDLASLDGAAVDIADFAIGDLVSGAQKTSPAAASPLAQLRGGSSRVVRLTSPHLNLSITSQTIEKDSTLLLQTLSKRAQGTKGSSKKSSELALINAVGQFVAEIFVSTAAVYRSTATLQVDEESSAAQQHWLWTQGLCDLSRGRRARILQQLQLDDGSVKSLWSSIQDKDYDEIAVHPVEAGMMKAAAKAVPKAQPASKSKA